MKDAGLPLLECSGMRQAMSCVRRRLRRVSALVGRRNLDEKGGILTLWALLVVPVIILLAIVSFESMRALTSTEAMQETADDLALLVALDRRFEAGSVSLAAGVSTNTSPRARLPLEDGCRVFPREGCGLLRSIIYSSLGRSGIYTDTLQICYSAPTAYSSAASDPKSGFISITGVWYQEPNTVFLWPDGARISRNRDISDLQSIPDVSGLAEISRTGDRLDGDRSCATPLWLEKEIEDQSGTAGTSFTVDLDDYFGDLRDSFSIPELDEYFGYSTGGTNYQASSDSPGVVDSTVSGSVVTIDGSAAATATITVTATFDDGGELETTVESEFDVTIT